MRHILSFTFSLSPFHKQNTHSFTISVFYYFVTLDLGFEPRLSQTRDNVSGIYWFPAKHGALRSKSKDWLSRNQYNVSGWSNISTRRLLFQWASALKIQLSVLVSYKVDIIIIISFAFAMIKQQSLTHSKMSLKLVPIFFKMINKTVFPMLLVMTAKFHV